MKDGQTTGAVEKLDLMPRERLSRTQRVTYAVLGLATMVAMVIAVISGIKRQEYARCQAEITDAIVLHLGAIERAQGIQLEADRKIREAQLSGDDFRLRQAAGEYISAIDETERALRDSPLPPLPTETCP